LLTWLHRSVHLHGAGAGAGGGGAVRREAAVHTRFEARLAVFPLAA
jgi:hypothetical protein